MSVHFSITSSQIFLILVLFFSLPASYSEERQFCTGEEYRQFDFWIGDWEVRDSKGNIVGTNNIYPILNGCALSENWLSARGNAGVSYNFYDKAENKWHQTWIDQGGRPLYLDGEFKDGSMQLLGYSKDKKGNRVKHKITWTLLKDKRVKQHWQTTDNNDETWKELFIGFYSKK